MNLVTIDDARSQCRVDGADNDADLQACIDAADDYVPAYLRRALYADAATLAAANDETGIVAGAAIKMAARILVAHYYAYREATTEPAATVVPFGVRDLLEPFRRKVHP